MRFDVYFTPAETTGAELTDKAVVVIDVLRATSTMVEALAAGAKGIFAVERTEEAVKLIQAIGRGSALLCGERRCVRIEGFDLGNSPFEFTSETVGGQTLVMSTTNGTPAIQAVAAARRVLIGSFLNLSAVVDALKEEENVAVVCAGRERRFALEDSVCAGMIGQRLQADATLFETNDAGEAALSLADRFGESLQPSLSRTAAAQQLAAVGLTDDIAYCLSVDRHDVVPQLRERQITL